MTVKHIVKFDMPLCVDAPKCERVTLGLGGAGSGGPLAELPEC